MNSVVDYMPMDRRHALVHGTPLPEYTIGAVLFADLAGFTPVTEAIVRALGPSRLQRGWALLLGPEGAARMGAPARPTTTRAASR